ncbi:MAG TPA: hypothetical protein DIT10_13165 [Chryseobacterium sp.]|nr:hypothetical protein [Chryseobacterium sp.]
MILEAFFIAKVSRSFCIFGIISTTTIYFDELHQPDLAKNISKTLISNSLITTKTRIFDLKRTMKVLRISKISKMH